MFIFWLQNPISCVLVSWTEIIKTVKMNLHCQEGNLQNLIILARSAKTQKKVVHNNCFRLYLQKLHPDGEKSCIFCSTNRHVNKELMIIISSTQMICLVPYSYSSFILCSFEFEYCTNKDHNHGSIYEKLQTILHMNKSIKGKVGLQALKLLATIKHAISGK